LWNPAIARDIPITVYLGVAADLSGALGARWPTWSASQPRRQAAGRKLQIYNENHLPLVHQQIDACLGGGVAAGYVKLFSTRSPNLLLAVANAIAVAYRHGCQRTLKDAAPPLAAAFKELVRESGIERRAAGINARSWVAGPHIIAPHFTKRGKLALDIIGPDACDVERDGDDIDRVLWSCSGGYILLDADRWTYFDKMGNELKPEEGTDPMHAVGLCPAVPFVSFDGGPDWWAQSAHNGLVDATLLIGYKSALGLFFRQVMGSPQTVIFSEIEKMPPGQVLGHPIMPLLLGQQDKVQIFDERVVSAKDYLDEISALLTMAISAEGLPPGSVTLVANNNDWGNLAINAEGPRLAVHRDKMVPFLKKSEFDLWPNVCDLVRGSKHRFAGVLPPGDEIREMLRIDFPDLSSPDEQLKRIQVMQAGLPYGLSAPSDIPVAAKPEVSIEEVEEKLASNLLKYVASIEPLVKRNIPADAPEANGYQSVAQEQGRIGGRESGKSRALQVAQENDQ
jgi:hypothetical protein